jgi:hypothetical protein
MNLQQLKSAIQQINRQELSDFAQWFETYLADDWDRQIEEDIKAGRLDHLSQQALDDFESGRCKPL